jgi:hypothetical protein
VTKIIMHVGKIITCMFFQQIHPKMNRTNIITI